LSPTTAQLRHNYGINPA